MVIQRYVDELTYLVVLVEAKGAVAFVGGYTALVEIVATLEQLNGLVLVPLIEERHRALLAAQTLRHASSDLQEEIKD